MTNPHAEWLAKLADFIRDVLSPSEYQRLKFCAEMLEALDGRPAEPSEHPAVDLLRQWLLASDDFDDVTWARQVRDLVEDGTMPTLKSSEHPFRANCTCPSDTELDPRCQIGFPHPWHRAP